MDHEIITIRTEIEAEGSYNNCCFELLSTIHGLVGPFPREAYLHFDPPVTNSGYIPPKHTTDIKKLAESSLKDLLLNHTISDGRVVLRRHLPNFPGSGYDWLPDPDDYDETALILKNPLVRLDLAPRMCKEDMKKFRDWYSSIVEKYK